MRVSSTRSCGCPARIWRSIWFLRHGMEPSGTAIFDDYLVDAHFGDFNRDGMSELAVLTVPARSVSVSK